MRLTERGLALVAYADGADARLTDRERLTLAIEVLEPSGWTRLLVSDFDHIGERLSRTQDFNSTSTKQVLAAAEHVAQKSDVPVITPSAIIVALALTSVDTSYRFVETVADAFDWLLPADPIELLNSSEVADADGQESLYPQVGSEIRETEIPDRRRLNRRVFIGARFGTWLMLAFVVLGFASSQAWMQLPPDDTIPPFRNQVLASEFPNEASISKTLGTTVVLTQDGPPMTPLMVSRTPFAIDIRDGALESYWSRGWSTADRATEITVEMSDTRHPGPALGVHLCTPEAPLQWGPPTTAVGYVYRGSKNVTMCATSTQGVRHTYIRLSSGDATVEARAPSIIREVQAALPNAAPVADHTTSIPVPASRAAMLRVWIIFITLVPLVWMATSSLDTATLQKLVNRKIGRITGRANQINIESDASSRRAATRFWAMFQWAAAVWATRTAEIATLTPNKTALLVVGVVLFIALVGRRALQRGQRTGGFRGRSLILGFVGVAITALILAAGLLIGEFAAAISSTGLGAQIPEWMSQRLSLLLLCVVPLVALFAAIPLSLMRSLAMRALRSDRTFVDDRPVLLLRSFADDKRRIRTRSRYRRGFVDEFALRRRERFEEVIAYAMGSVGPVIAVGQLGERLPPALGAVRRQVGSEEWKERVGDYMANAALILVSLGRSESLVWEIRRILQLGYLAKTIFVLPPTALEEQRKRLAVLGSALDIPWEYLDTPRGYALTVSFGRTDTTPWITYAACQDDIAYDVALQNALERAEASPPDHPVGKLKVNLPTGRPPIVQVYAVGSAPKVRRFPRWAVWLTPYLISSLALPVLLRSVGVVSDQGSVYISPSHSFTSLTVDRATGRTYAVVDSYLLVAIDFGSDEESSTKPGTYRIIAETNGLTSIDAAKGRLIAANLVDDSLTAYAADDGAVLWSTRANDLVSVRAVGDSIYALSPETEELLTFSALSGKLLKSVPLHGMPRAMDVQNGTLAVTLYDLNKVVMLDADDLRVRSSYATPPHPYDVALLGGHPLVASADKHFLLDVANPNSDPIWTRRQLATIASNGTVAAIQGLGQVSSLSSIGVKAYLMTTNYGQSDPCVVDNSGRVIAAGGSELHRFAQ